MGGTQQEAVGPVEESGGTERSIAGRSTLVAVPVQIAEVVGGRLRSLRQRWEGCSDCLRTQHLAPHHHLRRLLRGAGRNGSRTSYQADRPSTQGRYSAEAPAAAAVEAVARAGAGA